MVPTETIEDSSTNMESAANHEQIRPFYTVVYELPVTAVILGANRGSIHREAEYELELRAKGMCLNTSVYNRPLMGTSG